MSKSEETADRYRELLQDASKRYVLVQSDPNSKDLETCLVYDLETKTALLEEDDDVYRELKTRLAQNGVPILLSIPR
jgi:hypothetical protein